MCLISAFIQPAANFVQYIIYAVFLFTFALFVKTRCSYQSYLNKHNEKPYTVLGN